MKPRKFEYYKIIQQAYAPGYGWEDCASYPANSKGNQTKDDRQSLKSDLKEYRLMGYPTRVIFRREPIAQTA